MLLYLRRRKLLQLFSLHTINQQVSPCYHRILTVTQSYQSNVTPIGELHTKKIAKAILLYVFRIAFPASLFPNIWNGAGLPPSKSFFCLACKNLKTNYLQVFANKLLQRVFK